MKNQPAAFVIIPVHPEDYGKFFHDICILNKNTYFCFIECCVLIE